jgi:Fic family protein
VPVGIFVSMISGGVRAFIILFEKIHPFGDGNGRVGRLLMNVILWDAGYPILIIEYRKRASYYRALEKSEEKFIQYFMRRYLAAHKGFLKESRSHVV